MYSPSLHGLLVQANGEELHRSVQASHRRRAVSRPPAAPLTTLINWVRRPRS
jgi:hypothetical protein